MARQKEEAKLGWSEARSEEKQVRREGKGSVRRLARTEGTVVNSNEQYFRFGFSLLCWFGSDLPSVLGSVRMNSTFGSAHEQYFRFGPS